MKNLNVVNLSDLPAKLSDILIKVEQDKKEYIVVKNGVRVAVIRPFTNKQTQKHHMTKEEKESLFNEVKILSAKISECWEDDESAADAVSNDRR